MDRTAVGNLRKSFTLLFRKISSDAQGDLDAIYSPVFALALTAVPCMNLPVRESHRDAFERPLLALGVHPQGH